MRDLEWKTSAIADLMAIVDYISDDNPDAAQALQEDIETKVSRLRDNPRLYRVGRVDGTREMACVRTTSSSMPRIPTPLRYFGCCTPPGSGPKHDDGRSAISTNELADALRRG